MYISSMISGMNAILKEVQRNNDVECENVQTEKVGRKQTSALRTTVSFTDGFTYISHKAARKQYLASYTLNVTKEVLAEIIVDAVKAHKDAVDKNKQKPN